MNRNENPPSRLADPAIGNAEQEIPAVIETKDVWRVYQLGTKEVPALRGVDLKVGAGRFVT